MTRDAFDALIHRLEKVARKHPRLYLLRVALLVGLAYGYLALVLVASLAVALGVLAVVVMAPNVFTIKFGIILFIIAGGLFTAIARGLWVRLESPEGLRLTREEVPALFALLDHLCQAVNCRPFHDVLLMGAFNAAVTQVPRLGVFGWHRNYLLLGLPLLQGLGPEEFKAVLAHEFTHSSRGHGRFGNWVYRVRRSWQRIFEQMARQKSGGGAVLVNFLQWFWPRFNAHAFVLARANEYEADACSARLAGAVNAASALLRLPVQGRLLEDEFWPGVFNRVSAESEPPSDIFLTAAKYQRGTCHLVTPRDDIVATVSRLGVRLRRPVLTDIRLRGAWELPEAGTPDLHAGETLNLPSRGAADARELEWEGKRPDGSVQRGRLRYHEEQSVGDGWPFR